MNSGLQVFEHGDPVLNARYGRGAQTGVAYPPVPAQLQAITLVANRGFCYRVKPSETFAATTLKVVVTTAAGADDACDVGIFDAAHNKIVTAGATAGKLNTTGVKTFTIAATILTAGTNYYFAFSCGAIGGTAAQVGGMSYAASLIPTIFGATPGLIEQDAKASQHPLPTSWGAISSAVTAGAVLVAAVP